MNMNWYAVIARSYFARWLPQWYEQIDDPDSFFAALGEKVSRQVDEFADELAGDARPGEGYLAQAGRLFAARAQAAEIVLRERVFLPPEPADGDDPDEEEDDAPPRSGERPMVVDRNHQSWAEVDAEQQERAHDPESG
jgi:hypothetical protein